MAPKAKESSQAVTFTLDTVAALVAALYQTGRNLGMKDYELMAKLDGNHTASSFDHQFRKVKARAKELAGEPITPQKNGDAKNGSGTKRSKYYLNRNDSARIY